MAFDGSGTYNLPTPEYPAVAGETILASDWNAILEDLQTALSLCLTRDGQATATANIPMGSKKLTGLADGASASDSAAFGQIGAAVTAERTATATLTNKTLTTPVLTTPTITNYTETLYAPAAGTAFTVDLANGTVQKFESSGNLTITLPAAASGKGFTVIIKYGANGHTLTWAGGSTIKWPGGTTPSATSVLGKFDIYHFFSDGTNTYGNSGGSNY